MSNPTGREMFRKYTGKAGDINRQLGLAGIALIWLLHGRSINTPLKDSLMVAFWCIAISLTLDLAQYIVGSIMWGWNFKANDATTCNKTIGTSVGFIFVKLIIMFVGYAAILYFLIRTGFVRL